MPRDFDYDDPADGPGVAGVRAAAEQAWDDATSPEPDAVDDALVVLRRARAILGDAKMMSAIRERQRENAAALEAK